MIVGTGTIQLPGGHLEFGEDIATCAARETLEETGLVVKPAAKIAAVTNDYFAKEGKHYVTLFVWCDMVDPTATPEVCFSLPSFSWSSRLVLRGMGADTGSQRRSWSRRSATAGRGPRGKSSRLAKENQRLVR